MDLSLNNLEEEEILREREESIRNDNRPQIGIDFNKLNKI